MAYADTTAAAADRRPAPDRRPARRGLLTAFLDGLDFLATLGPRTEALRRLSAMSDAQLAARNTTRDAEVRRIVGIGSWI